MAGVLITKIISSIESNIPHEILEMGRTRVKCLTIDEFIKNEIMIKRINVDLDGRVGKLTHIQINPSWRISGVRNGFGNNATQLNNGIGYYKIPPTARNGRPIITVESSIPMGIGGGVFAGMGVGNETTIDNFAGQMLDSRIYNQTPATPTARLEDGTVDIISIAPDIMYETVVSCKLGYDENYTNACVSFIECIKKLSVIATKMWFYNRFIISIEDNVVRGGYSIGTFRDIIEGYSSAIDDYPAALTATVYSNDYDKSTIATRMRRMM